MAVFRVEKTRDYTVMANHHLRNTELSLKAKGLLSLMLSLPEEWDYTTKGLSRICKDGVDSICAGVRELEEHGYVVRERIRNPNGQLGAIEYTILEQPQEPKREKPERENPVQANPVLDYPVLGKPEQENPAGNDLRQCKSLCKSNINHTDDACSKELDHRKLDAVHVERITIHREDMEGKEQCAKQCDHIAAIDAERFRYTEEKKANRCHDRTDPTANTDPFSEEETDERNKDNIERRNKRGLARSCIQQTELLHIACRGKQHTADHAADKILSSERRNPVRLHLSA